MVFGEVLQNRALVLTDRQAGTPFSAGLIHGCRSGPDMLYPVRYILTSLYLHILLEIFLINLKSLMFTISILPCINGQQAVLTSLPPQNHEFLLSSAYPELIRAWVCDAGRRGEAPRV